MEGSFNCPKEAHFGIDTAGGSQTRGALSHYLSPIHAFGGGGTMVVVVMVHSAPGLTWETCISSLNLNLKIYPLLLLIR